MGSQTPTSWEELKPGTKILVGYHDLDGIVGYRFIAPGKPATIVSTTCSKNGCLVALLDEVPAVTVGTFCYRDSPAARGVMFAKYLTDVTHLERRFCWIESPSAVRLPKELDLSTLTHYGPVTCACGFSNADVMMSSFVNKKYVCYKCRVIEAQQRSSR